MDNEKYSLGDGRLSRGSTDPRRVQKEDIKAARELCYPKVVIELLRNEPSASKRQRILCDARNGKYDRK